MKISIIHPSRSRPQQAFETFTKWHNSADNIKDVEYVLSLDNEDNDLANYLGLFNPCLITLSLGDNNSAIEAINGATEYANGDLIIVISDDFYCPEHWDTLLLNELQGKYDFVVKTQDGIQPTLITMPILDRTYYNRFGYVYHPDYKHLWCDCELTVVGHYLGRVINSNLLFTHNHYTTGKSEKDAINDKNDLTHEQGQTIFNERLKINFGIENPLIEYNQIKWH